MIEKYESGRIFMAGLKKGKDLLNELSRIVTEKNIETGIIKVIGAVSSANISYYDHNKQKYIYNEINEGLEILNCTGNISVLEDKPMIHAHITLANKKGEAFGGHLAEGTKVFASEAYIQELKGHKLIRTFKEDTGLTLW